MLTEREGVCAGFVGGYMQDFTGVTCKVLQQRRMTSPVSYCILHLALLWGNRGTSAG
jgi:hypothetical protein